MKGGMARVPDINDEDIDVMMATNITGLIHMTQAVMAVFKRRPNGGVGDIINVGSIAGMSVATPCSIPCRVFRYSL